MKLWDKAISNLAKGSFSSPYSGGTIFTYQYKAGSAKRTMCVVSDANDYVYGGKNYGVKGTAYWVAGHVGPAGCKKD
ncbi:hypothetical protein GCM10020367_06500 [Streptomyces sannanensis]|uniref:Uncharacterized protein n=1 Tax=Streptomyces sannanensis TaxID=285536 RepID=A0ABP6S514_9ACTN